MTFETILAREGRLVYRTRGVSMEPMLRQNRDIVVIAAVSGRLKKYDVACTGAAAVMCCTGSSR